MSFGILMVVVLVGNRRLIGRFILRFFFFERISLQPAALRGTRGGTWIAVIIVKLIKLSATQLLERAWSHLQRRLDGVLQRVQVA